MFGEAAWDILLALFIADQEFRRTTLRWIRYLEEEQFVTRRRHPLDARCYLRDLTDFGRDEVARYLAWMEERHFPMD
jgi:hypothetical protein